MSLFDNDETVGKYVYTVSALAAKIGQTLRSEFGTDLWVEGEIANLSRSAAGHVYFSLTEPTEVGQQSPAVISVSLFKSNKEVINRTLKASGAGRIEDGMAIRIRGTLDFYGPQGSLQVRMTGIDPSYTIGQMVQDREKILAKLSAEGLLDANGLSPLPVQPRTIGLVTSGGSAAYEDFLSELEKSGLGWTVNLFDSRVQGRAAIAGLSAAIAAAGTNSEVVAVIRGGGSKTDLVAFDSEEVARAIAACPVPVITGIGHEIDRAIADEAAAIATKTPTAAARVLIDMVNNTQAAVDEAVSRLTVATHALLTASSHLIETRAVQLDQAVTASTRLAQNHIQQLQARTPRAVANQLARATQRIDALASSIALVDPANLLARGWSISTDKNGNVIKSLDSIKIDDTIDTTTQGGKISSTVTAVHPSTEGNQ